jgi:hypothetical protein
MAQLLTLDTRVGTQVYFARRTIRRSKTQNDPVADSAPRTKLQLLNGVGENSTALRFYGEYYTMESSNW